MCAVTDVSPGNPLFAIKNIIGRESIYLPFSHDVRIAKQHRDIECVLLRIFADLGNRLPIQSDRDNLQVTLVAETS